MFESQVPAAHSVPIQELVGQTLSGKFRVRRILGQGGMGSVLEVEHVLTHRVGALKLLHAAFASIPEIVERFTREASAAGRIGSERIVQTFDAGRLDDGAPYIFMELLHGLTLESLLADRGQLRFDEAAAIITQAAEGLVAAHAAGIVHRDIKPANLFLVERGQLVKLLDFGISKFESRTGVSALTSAGTAMGTPHYMPPEQIVGGVTDERADLYSLGVVLYECVVGAPPYQADTLPALSVRIHEGRYTPVSARRSDTPSDFDVVIQRCLALAPAQRFHSASELIGALTERFGSNAAALMPTLYASSAPPAHPVLTPERGNSSALRVREALAQATLAPPSSAEGASAARPVELSSAQSMSVASMSAASLAAAATFAELPPKESSSGGSAAAPTPTATATRRASLRFGVLLALLGTGLAGWRWLQTPDALPVAPAVSTAPAVPTLLPSVVPNQPESFVHVQTITLSTSAPAVATVSSAASLHAKPKPAPRAAGERTGSPPIRNPSPAVRDGLQESNPYAE